jgi:LysM repeat protein
MTHSLYHSAAHPFPSMTRPSSDRSGNRGRTGNPGRTGNGQTGNGQTGNDGRLVSSPPNYAARRAVALVVMFLTLVAVAGVLVLLAGTGARPASASRAEPAISPADLVHVAKPGDSLWSIAQAHRGDVALDRYVDALIDVNGGTDVQIGQAIRLP